MDTIGSSVDFILNLQYLFIRKCVKISSFWDILSYQFVRILNTSCHELYGA